jgi:CheY-like chemotaxis protein
MMTTENPHVLLIEDNPNNIKLMVMLLEQQNYRVTVDTNAEAGIVNAKQILPDLILLDIQLLEMDGMEACRIMRKDSNLQYTPIIALTAFAMPGDKERILENGFNEYMSKPINYRDFLNLVTKILHHED